MDHPSRFSEVLEAVDQLSADDQEALVDIVRRRVAERARARIVAEVRESDAEHQAGRCRPVSPDELMDELHS